MLLPETTSGRTEAIGEFGSDVLRCDWISTVPSREGGAVSVEMNKTEKVVECRQIHPKPEATSLHIPVRLEGRRIAALVDTGATNSFIQKALVKKLQLTAFVKETSTRVKLADGSVHDLDGYLDLHLDINGFKFQTGAYVIAGKGPSLVLGTPVFLRHGWLIDMRNGRLLKPDGGIFITGSDESANESNQVMQREPRKVVNPKVVKIPAQGVKTMGIQVMLSEGEQVFFRETPSLFTGLVVMGQTDKTGICKVSLVNTQDVELVVPAGSEFACMYTVGGQKN